MLGEAADRRSRLYLMEGGIVSVERDRAFAEGMPIATADRRFAAYGVQIVW